MKRFDDFMDRLFGGIATILLIVITIAATLFFAFADNAIFIAVLDWALNRL